MKTITGNKTTKEWDKVRIGDALKLINGRAFKPSEWREKGLPIVRIQNLNNPEAPFNHYEGDLPEKFSLNNGDLLFAWSGTPGTSFGAHIWRGGKAWLNQHIFKVMFDDADFDKKFLQLAINQNLNEYIRAAHGGAGLAHITKGRFEQSELAKPTLDEQRDIVAEIEKQFSRLDEAVANLKRVKANLKRYKASVLKAAVEGKLTESWRKQHPDVEPASKLLERILSERRVKWSGKGTYKEPSQFLEGDCPGLPANWAWASLDSIANVIDPNPSHRMPKYIDNGVPLISSENFIGSDDIDFTIGKTVPDKVLQEQKARCAIREGDFVLTRIGTIGKTRFLPPSQTYCLSHALVIIQGLTSDINRRYLRYVVASDATIEQAKLGVQSVGVPDLGMAKIRAFRIPLTCEAEQKEIVAQVERRLSVIEELEATVEANLTRADRLRQAILNKAFKGNLIP